MSVKKVTKKEMMTAFFHAFYDSHEERPKNRTDYGKLRSAVFNHLQQNGFNDEDFVSLFSEILWYFISIGAIAFEFGDNGGFISQNIIVTEYGKNVFSDKRIHPSFSSIFIDFMEQFDFIKEDGVLMLYIQEALATYKHGLYFGSIILLGIYSEGLLDKLASSISESFNDKNEGMKWKKVYDKNWRASYRSKLIQEKLHTYWNDKPRFSSLYPALIFLVKTYRDEVGHVAGEPKNEEDALEVFFLVKRITEYVSELISWLESEKRY